MKFTKTPIILLTALVLGQTGQTYGTNPYLRNSLLASACAGAVYSAYRYYQDICYAEARKKNADKAVTDREAERKKIQEDCCKEITRSITEQLVPNSPAEVNGSNNTLKAMLDPDLCSIFVQDKLNAKDRLPQTIQTKTEELVTALLSGDISIGGNMLKKGRFQSLQILLAQTCVTVPATQEPFAKVAALKDDQALKNAQKSARDAQKDYREVQSLRWQDKSVFVAVFAAIGGAAAVLPALGLTYLSQRLGW